MWQDIKQLMLNMVDAVSVYGSYFKMGYCVYFGLLWYNLGLCVRYYVS
tara:strand:- start:1315 stop:1458 length:144 start_codon:yes stop_codon:yes gene_type:complete